MTPDRPRLGATTRSFEEKYLRFQSEVGAAFRAETGGEVANGWTTRDQAEWMTRAFGLEAADRLLDLGAGRGWPGGLIARRSGATLVSIDVPLVALRQGADWLRGTLERPAFQVCADGRALPIGDGHFAAVCHADVLC